LSVLNVIAERVGDGDSRRLSRMSRLGHEVALGTRGRPSLNVVVVVVVDVVVDLDGDGDVNLVGDVEHRSK